MTFRGAATRVGIFVLISALAGVLLYTTVSRGRIGVDTRSYTAVFADVSALEEGDEVRIAGVRVGQVTELALRAGNRIEVDFTVRDGQPVTRGTRAVVRYADLINGRYLELVRGHGQHAELAAGGEIPLEHTSPAIDLNVLLGGFKPLFRGLQPEQINKLASDIVGTLQGNGGTVRSLLRHTASLTRTLADRDEVIGDLVNNLNAVLDTFDQRGERVGEMVSSLQRLVSGLANDRGEIGSAIEQIDGLASQVTGLLADVRQPLQGTLDAAHRIATTLDENSAAVGKALNDLPAAYRRLHRVGSYGSFFNFYLCSVQVKITGPDGKPMLLPAIGSNSKTARCQP